MSGGCQNKDNLKANIHYSLKNDFSDCKKSTLEALKVYKTLHNLNPAFMKDYFLPKSTTYDLRRNDVLFVPKVKTTNYGIRAMSFFGSKDLELSSE